LGIRKKTNKFRAGKIPKREESQEEIHKLVPERPVSRNKVKGRKYVDLTVAVG